MKIYKFFDNVDYAVKAVKENRIRLSRFDSLNDPFELLSTQQKSRSHRVLDKKKLQEINENYGLACFSNRYTSVLMWSHYAKGVGACLEFQASDDLLLPVEYIANKRIEREVEKQSKSKINIDTVKAIAKYKSIHWSYEQEVRLITNLNQHPSEPSGYDNQRNFFLTLDQNLYLTGFIFGPQDSNVSESAMKSIQILNPSLEVSHARIAFNSFIVLKRRDKILASHKK